MLYNHTDAWISYTVTGVSYLTVKVIASRSRTFTVTVTNFFMYLSNILQREMNNSPQPSSPAGFIGGSCYNSFWQFAMKNHTSDFIIFLQKWGKFVVEYNSRDFLFSAIDMGCET